MTTLHKDVPKNEGQVLKSVSTDKVFTYSSSLNAWEKLGSETAEISSITPTSFSGGDPVILTGSGFTGATDIKLNANSANSFIIDSDTQITVTPQSVVNNTDTFLSVVLANGTYLKSSELLNHTISTGTDLVFYYKAEDLTDSSGAGRDLTENSGVLTFVTGIQGNAFDFPASTFLTRPSDTDLAFGDRDFSVFCWINPDSLAGQHIISKDSLSNREFLLFLNNNGVIAAQIGEGVSNTTAPSAISPSATISLNSWQWVYVEYESSANRLELFVDNVSEGVNSNVTITPGVATNVDLAIGARPNGEVPFNGQVDQVGKVNRLLTPSERASIYNGGVGIADLLTIL